MFGWWSDFSVDVDRSLEGARERSVGDVADGCNDDWYWGLH